MSYENIKFNLLGNIKYFLLISAISFSIFIMIGGIAAILSSNQEAIREHVKEDLPNVVAAISSGDVHTECLVLSSAIEPNTSFLRSILDPKMLVSADPCVGLQEALSHREDIGWVSYSRYWMGSDYLGLIALDFLNLSDIHDLYKTLLIVSIAFLAASGFIGLRKGLRIPLLVASAGIAAGIGIVKFGGHIGHSPVYFLSLYALSIIIAFSSHMSDWKKAVIIGCIMGNIVGYYDILSGAIPFITSLSIFIYYLMWKGKSNAENGINNPLFYIFLMMVNYVLSIVALVLIKLFSLLLLNKNLDAVVDFFNEFSLRVSGEGLPGNIWSNIFYVFRRLWWDNGSVYIGGETVSTILLYIGLISWLFSMLFSIRKILVKKNFDYISDFSFILMAASSIVIWFMVFRNHGYGHAWFMTRILCIIPTFGIVAALMVARPPQPPDRSV